MNLYLLRQAIKAFWCNPGQDRQRVYRLVRRSPKYGARYRLTIDHTHLRMPNNNYYYHIYQLGRIEPKLLGLDKEYFQWRSLTELMDGSQLWLDCYLENGIQFPRSEVHLLLMANMNLLIAVRVLDERVHTQEGLDVFLRFYNNAYFDSARASANGHTGITVKSANPKTEQEIVDFQIEIQALITAMNIKYPIVLINGRTAKFLPTLTNCMEEDFIDVIFDPSIFGVMDYFRFSAVPAPSFLSTMDNLNKFILHVWKKHPVAGQGIPELENHNEILFYDDLEAVLFKAESSKQGDMGVFYHRNHPTWLRQLTHRDYSIPVSRLNTFVNMHPDDPRKALRPDKFTGDHWANLNDSLIFRLYFRYSGYSRPLSPECGRILEMYRLNDKQILNVMTGIDANVPAWRAENLEKSKYIEFMQAQPSVIYPTGFNLPEVTNAEKTFVQELAGAAYGYHAAASVIAHTPTPIDHSTGIAKAKLAYAYWEDTTVYEYDKDGVYLGHYYQAAGRNYFPHNPECELIEAMIGKGGDNLNSVYGKDTVPLKKEYNFRVYVVKILGGIKQGGWMDITDLPNRGDWGHLDETDAANPKWVWVYDAFKWFGCVRQDDRFLAYDLTLNKTTGSMRFSVGSYENQKGLTDYGLLEIPFGQLDIWLNGRALIEGLDYSVHWPKIVITNLEYIDQSKPLQSIHVRGYGFCENDLTRPKVTEHGFIEYGVLSNDLIYNIHSHKVQRVIIDGHYRDPATVHYEEDYGTLTVTNERNGAPYSIQTPPVVFKDVYKYDKEARDKDDKVDEEVSAYMYKIFPKRPRNYIDTILNPYRVISPFANKVLHDLKSGVLNPPNLDQQYSELKIQEWLKPYEWLLDYDICNTDYDEIHVKVYPHWYGVPVSLTTEQYSFYKRALQLYLNKTPDISVFVYVQ